MKNKYLIVYSGLPEFMNNQVLNQAYMSQFHGGEVIYQLLYKFICEGFLVETIDLYINRDFKPDALLISDMTNGIDFSKYKNLSPILCYCLESPIIANRFFFYLNQRTRQFKYLATWGGAESILKNGVIFKPIKWPNLYSEPIVIDDWSARSLLVLISGNKKPFKWNLPSLNSNNYLNFVSFLSGIHTQFIKITSSFVKCALYKEKLKCIKYFSKLSNFHIYGIGWNALDFFGQIQFNYKGEIKLGPVEKLNILKKYKFSLCFENMIFDGYITEKIFDCFFVGTIPIYKGASDIQNFIPNDCYIKYDDFGSLEDLEKYILGLSDKDIQKYHDAINKFLDSDLYEGFYYRNFIDRIFNLVSNSI